MVKTNFVNKASSPGIKQQQQGNMISKTIGTINRMGLLRKQIDYKEVAEALQALGDKDAGILLNQLKEQGPAIQDPTGWLKKAASRAASGGGVARKGGASGGAGNLPPQMLELLKGFGVSSEQLGKLGGSSQGQKQLNVPSLYVSKAIGMLNKENTLQQPIMFKDAAPHLAAIPESLAIDLVRQLSSKADTVKDPTNWLIASAKKGLEKGNKGTTEMSKKIGQLNQKNVLKEPIKWSTVCGPLLLISDEEANGLVDELEQNAQSINHPTNWLQAAATKLLNSYTKGK